MGKRGTGKNKVAMIIAKATDLYSYRASMQAKPPAAPAVSGFARLPGQHDLLALLKERIAGHSVVEEASHWMRVCPFTYTPNQRIPEPARRGMAHFLIVREIRRSGVTPAQSGTMASLLEFLEKGDNLDWVVHTAKLLHNGIRPEEDAKTAELRSLMRRLGTAEHLSGVAEHARKMMLAIQTDKVNNVETLRAFEVSMGLGHIVARGGGYAERLMKEVAEAVDIYLHE